MVALADENIKGHEAILNSVRERAEAGSLGLGDVKQAEARLAEAVASYTDYERQLENARIGFEARFIGQAPDEDVSRPEFDDSLLPDEARQALAMIDSHPAVVSAKYGVDASEASVNESLSSFLPVLEAEASASREYNREGVKKRSDNFSAMLVVSWNLFEGGRKFNNVREQRQRVGQARALEMQRKREVTEQIRESWNDIVRRDLQSKALIEEVVANTRVLEVYHEEFDLGLRDLLDLLDAESNLNSSQIALVNTECQALFSRYRLLASGGKLLESLKIETSSLD